MVINGKFNNCKQCKIELTLSMENLSIVINGKLYSGNQCKIELRISTDHLTILIFGKSYINCDHWKT